MRVIFAGTPEFAAHHLQALIDASFNVIAVFTQPDRKAGRGQKVLPSLVKQIALEHNIDVHQPEKLKNNDEALKILADYKADIMIVVAYGLILPKAVLDTPKYGCLNVHASILPRWRGSAPIQRAIEAGDNVSGVSIMQMDEGLDTGDVLSTVDVPIKPEDTASILHDNLYKAGCTALIDVLNQYHELAAVPQDDALANYAHKISKQETLIDWSQSATDICNKIRAFNAWPVATAKHNDVTLRLWQAFVCSKDILEALSLGEGNNKRHNAEYGKVISIDKKNIYINTGQGVVAVTQIQKPGSKVMKIADLINGYDIHVGDVLEGNVPE